MSRVWHLRDHSAKHDLDAASTNQFAAARWWVKNDQLFRLEFFFAVIATDVFAHPAFFAVQLWRNSVGRWMRHHQM
ncbi:hypothetical protein [Bradyrhizobium elkanii]|uniref:hypothetical protein n=1 Tax=Bradyrhizobium elkanii TaxID=29448 RepID=UPI00209C9B96|nr:hypothetical protein [Bradyrhizobium elkanii]MCP1970826.1 hypothetical protein [Bradyrhizobium elkanii]MCS4107667.1 hypothetical protein [Bradyrhizobium elkanii]